MISRLTSVLRAGLRGEAVFAVIMMAASSLGFVKAFGVATILPPEEFGRYISLLGVATLCSILFSLGRVETTIKLYPTMFMRGQGTWIARHALKLWLKLFLLIAGVTGALSLSSRLVLSDPTVMPAADIALVAITAWMIMGLALVASLVRAISNTRLLQSFTLTRGAVVMGLTLPAAYVTESWRMTMVAETIAMAALLVLSAAWLYRPLRDNSRMTQTPQEDVAPEAFQGGLVLYLAGLIVATIPYGGRGAVLLLAGPAVAGAFGLLTLVVQIGVILAGSLSQKMGPRMIQSAAAGRLDASLMVSPVVLMAALSATSTVLLLSSLLVPAGAAFWQSYGIGAGLLMVVGVQLVLPCYLFLKFLLIARNDEQAILKSACVAATCFYLGLGLSSWLDLGLWGYVCAAAVADAMRVLVKSWFVFRKKEAPV